MRKGWFLGFVALLSACSSEENQFCACMEAGKKLDAETARIFDEEITSEQADKIKKLKTEQEEACANFQTMGGRDMLKLKEACEQ